MRDGGLLALAPDALASLCTDVASIRAFTASLLRAVGAVVIADAASNALGGCCSGLGLQSYAAIAQLGGYAVGMSAGAALAFGWLRGGEDGAFLLWGGLGLSMLIAAAIQLGLLCRHDWERSAAEASERLHRDQAAMGHEGRPVRGERAERLLDAPLDSASVNFCVGSAPEGAAGLEAAAE